MEKGSSTFAKALSTDTEYLRDLIEYCKGLPSEEDVVTACESNLKTVDLDVAADATYVSAISYVIYTWLNILVILMGNKRTWRKKG